MNAKEWVSGRILCSLQQARCSRRAVVLAREVCENGDGLGELEVAIDNRRHLADACYQHSGFFEGSSLRRR